MLLRAELDDDEENLRGQDAQLSWESIEEAQPRHALPAKGSHLPYADGADVLHEGTRFRRAIQAAQAPLPERAQGARAQDDSQANPCRGARRRARRLPVRRAEAARVAGRSRRRAADAAPAADPRSAPQHQGRVFEAHARARAHAPEKGLEGTQDHLPWTPRCRRPATKMSSEKARASRWRETWRKCWRELPSAGRRQVLALSWHAYWRVACSGGLQA
mmetsp:Transcript_30871/g.67612  ORF Transcript_30871/g.67612 Transcript_30871/m.67612 type:complete len:218 (-) Transcript_30871:175-828(-)